MFNALREKLSSKAELPTAGFAERQLLDYDKLEQWLQQHREAYRNGDPFPHIVIDDFLERDVVRELAQRFPDPNIKKKLGQADVAVDAADGTPAQLGKQWLSRESFVDITIRLLYWELNSGPFVDWLEGLTGIEGLLPDPHFLGGGVHKTVRGGYLKVHADFNKHGKFDLDRRLNLLIYLNEDWQDEYGGNLELWPADLSTCAKSIAPIAGRAVIFNTTSTAYHGHPQPLNCPPDRDRKSIALYYYSNGRPQAEQREKHGILWQETD